MQIMAKTKRKLNKKRWIYKNGKFQIKKISKNVKLSLFC